MDDLFSVKRPLPLDPFLSQGANLHDQAWQWCRPLFKGYITSLYTIYSISILIISSMCWIGYRCIYLGLGYNQGNRRSYIKYPNCGHYLENVICDATCPIVCTTHWPIFTLLALCFMVGRSPVMAPWKVSLPCLPLWAGIFFHLVIVNPNDFLPPKLRCTTACQVWPMMTTTWGQDGPCAHGNVGWS